MSFFFNRRKKDGDEGAAPPVEPPPVPTRGMLFLAPVECLPAPTDPYVDSVDHLRHELARVDQLVRAQTIRWQATIAEHKPPQDWGMAHVSHEEVDAYLRSAFRLASDPSADGPADFYLTAALRFAEAIRSRLEKTPPDVARSLRLPRLCERFGLSDVERDLLLVCLLPELDGRYRRLYSYLQDNAGRALPGAELILQIAVADRGALQSDGALLGGRLLRPVGDGDEPLSLRSLRVDDRLVAYLLGDDTVAGPLAELAAIEGATPWGELVLDEKREEQLRDIAAWQRGADEAAVLFLHGPDADAGRRVAGALCTDLGLPLLSVDVAAALETGAEWRETVALAFCEALLQGAALLWRRCERLLERDVPPGPWETLVAAAARYDGMTLLQSAVPWEPAGHFADTPFVRVDLPLPSFALRRRIWEKRLPPERANLAETLAGSFQMTESQMRDALATAWSLARQRSPAAPELRDADLLEACRRQAGRRLMTFARRIEPRTSLQFDDLVLPKSNKRQLHELRSRIRNRDRVYTGLGFERRIALGKGILALFTGASGTGKTMAAELLACEQGVDLYKVDLASVVSKWVGETEKNLAVLFAEAEDANAILFFDEADALYGKRGDVKEAKDRWANTEVNYLLQRVEEYAGVVILATNLRQNIDDAFLRRIHAIVDFPAPDALARFQIWRGMFPDGLGRPDDAVLEELAQRFRVSGGSIRNIVVDAAYRALAATERGEPVITHRHLVVSTAREYEKLGKPLTRGEFGDDYYAWIEEDIL